MQTYSKLLNCHTGEKKRNAKGLKTGVNSAAMLSDV